jgi:hypothetical protein
MFLFLIIISVIIIIVIIISLFLKKKYNNCEKFQDVSENKINPIVEIAKEHSRLQILKDENENMEKVTKNLEIIKNDLENKIRDLKFTIDQKKEEKIKIENDLNEIEKQKTDVMIAFKALKDRVDDTTKKENELLIKEETLNKKLSEIPKLSEIKCNQDIIDIQKKLEVIGKNINKINEDKIDQFCVNTKQMPTPIFKTYTEKENDKDLSYKWCLCNDTNKNTENCVSYIKCKNNYDTNKDKSTVIGDDLDVYFKCIDKYNNFPKFLNKTS